MNNMDDTPKKTSAPISKLDRKIIDASLVIADSKDDTNPEFLHSVLCQVGLPRSPVKDSRTFERRSGNVSLLVQAGKIYHNHQWEDCGVPYGTKPRLVLMHACSEAVRTQSPVIEVGNSVRGFLKTLNMSTSGRGFKLFRNQMEALAASTFTIGMSLPTKDVTIHTHPIQEYEAWLTDTDNQASMWPGVLELSPKFYETLTQHAVPLDPRAIGALKHSALSLDVYTMLANRLCRIRNRQGTKLSWANLKDQFGQEYRTSKDFKKAYKKSLKEVLMVYPDAKIREEMGGLRFYTSPPPIKKTTVVGFSRKEEK